MFIENNMGKPRSSFNFTRTFQDVELETDFPLKTKGALYVTKIQ